MVELCGEILKLLFFFFGGVGGGAGEKFAATKILKIIS